MSVHSWPRGSVPAEPWLFRRSFDDGEDNVTRKGSRLRVPSKRLDMEDVRTEKALQLSKIRAGCLGALTKSRREIELLMSSDGNLTDVKGKLALREETWRRFVDSHEQYLMFATSEEDEVRVCNNYSEQLLGKNKFDSFVRSWCKCTKGKLKVQGIETSTLSSELGKSSSSVSSRKSQISSVSKKREKLAVAQLKVQKLKRQHDIFIRMEELKLQKELIEAETEEEEAFISLKFQEQAEMEVGSIEVRTGDDMNDFLERSIKHDMLLDKQDFPKSKLNFAEQSKPNLTASVDSKERVKSQEELSRQRTPQTPFAKLHPTVDTNTTSKTGETGYGGTNEVVQALQQIVAQPQIEYMHFNGDPLKYGAFIHNFETCLEKVNQDESRRLQLLIQHCEGKAKEAIESCVALPVGEGYKVAKTTLKENFGKPHIIAGAHISKLQNLPPLKNGEGQSLLEFTRHLDVAERTLTGMGQEYVSDLNHMNTLRELNKKLPMFLRAKWAETAGRIIDTGSRPKFADFLKFVKDRARLVNNEFGEDIANVKNSDKWKGKPQRGGLYQRVTTLATGTSQGVTKQNNGLAYLVKCLVCSEAHRIWKCNTFKDLPVDQRRKCARENSLCFKCLGDKHVARNCKKTHFKCQKPGCGKEHHTLLHTESNSGFSQEVESRQLKGTSDDAVCPQDARSVGSTYNEVTAATGAGEVRICLGVVPVNVKSQKGEVMIKTYALLDTGSEVTLCKQYLAEKLGIRGVKSRFTLTGMAGSKELDSQLIDIEVMSMDGKTSVNLNNVRAISEMPLSKSCIPRKEDLQRWPHLCDIELEEQDNAQVELIIGLKEKPTLFLPIEYRAGKEDEPVAVRYSLGWSLMGPVGGRKDSRDCSSNFLRADSVSDMNAESVETFSNVLQNSHVDGMGGYLKTDISMCAAARNDDLLSKCQMSAGSDLTDELEHENEHLQQQLERLWKTDFGDSLVDTKECNSVEDIRALEHIEGTLAVVNGHYQVALPWRSNPPYLPNNRSMAEKRLHLLRKRLMRDKDLYEKYKTAVSEYIEKGHAQKIPKEDLNVEDRTIWYLPHHPVTHQLKPNKVRVVFDCAAKYGGTSLNQQLLPGPDLTNPLVGVLLRFRQEQVGIAADIESMFHQVSVDPKDCDALRFLWWEDNDISKEVVEYRMVKHVFGATSSPSIVNFCLRTTANNHSEDFDLKTIDTVNRNMYVDDLIKSIGTVEQGIRLANQLRELLAKKGFRLTKWYSNERDVLAAIPEEERAKSVRCLDLDCLPTESALGMKWDTEGDTFVWDVFVKISELASQKPSTRRGILSVVCSLFDPMGFIAPYIMKAKLILQMLCRKSYGWDDMIGEEEKEQWKCWVEDLTKLQELKIERCFKPKGFSETRDVQLHLFSDASRQGYSSVAYLRLVDISNQIHCVFVLGKARLAPIREISIPRLELSAAVISVKLCHIIKEALDIKIDRVLYWTDSMSVLKCINNETRRFHTFESNRLTVIRNGSSVSEWRYVNRELNPADDGSKGLKLDKMLKNNRWLNGPSFLYEEEGSWPRVIETPAIYEDDPEVRKERHIYTATTPADCRNDVIDYLISYFSSWWKLKRAVAWLLRFKHCLRNKVKLRRNIEQSNENVVDSLKDSRKQIGIITVEELRIAEVEVIRHVQREAFPEVVELLSQSDIDERLTRKSMRKAGVAIYKLNPQFKGGVLRVGGRLNNAPIEEEMKHPIILPHKHHVTNLIIKQFHMVLGHMGQESVLASIRERFWIVKGRSAVRQVIQKCVDCQKRNKRLCEQFMADLPSDRVTPDKPPFTFVGIDFFGPLEVKQGRARVKRYGCLFTCLTMRGVHIEIAHSLDTNSMINALRRFISIRGHPEEIRSDRGTNFVKADKELNEAINGWNQDKISEFCAQREIRWVFNPPAASNMGGVWERVIRSVRQILRAILKEQFVGDEVLNTVMAEVVNILNSRPITRNSDSHLDNESLTPNHLLKLRSCHSLPPGTFNKEDSYCGRQWRQAQYLSNLFWQRWIKEYLPLLLERRKWNVPQRNLKVGDIVLLSDESYPRGQWPLSRVVEVLPSKDGYVRTVKIKTTSTVATQAKRKRRGEQRSSNIVLTRPVNKLCLLEMDV